LPPSEPFFGTGAVHDQGAPALLPEIFEKARNVHAQIGLTGNEATVRLESDGYNELPSAKPRSLWVIAWEVVREPMFLLLIGAAAIYLVLHLAHVPVVLVH